MYNKASLQLEVPFGLLFFWLALQLKSLVGVAELLLRAYYTSLIILQELRRAAEAGRRSAHLRRRHERFAPSGNTIVDKLGEELDGGNQLLAVNSG